MVSACGGAGNAAQPTHDLVGAALRLSMLARYEPATWVGLLNIDKNLLAVPLEGLLEDALEALPHLVLDALQASPFLLRPAPRYRS